MRRILLNYCKHSFNNGVLHGEVCSLGAPVLPGCPAVLTPNPHAREDAGLYLHFKPDPWRGYANQLLGISSALATALLTQRHNICLSMTCVCVYLCVCVRVCVCDKGSTFSKVLYIVTTHNKYAVALISQILFFVRTAMHTTSGQIWRTRISSSCFLPRRSTCQSARMFCGPRGSLRTPATELV